MSLNFIKLATICVVIGFANTAPAGHDYHPYEEQKEHKQIPIVKQSFEQHHGAFQHSFEAGNGIHVHEHGYFKESADKKHETLVQQGTITYHDEHGNPITLTYIADENGFQPQGAHLPTPPPIPAEIAKALEHLPHHPEPAHEEAQHHYEQQYY
ncbi:endocuticle structural glycoprotein SgAbd-2-like [Atheta coriaria]|uniref:endocuticle structural glycoprotein SgAbd-2-like n=1 Tax=Dalotia coriaria TaxID=877792 RepID=UPI0031F413D8